MGAICSNDVRDGSVVGQKARSTSDQALQLGRPGGDRLADVAQYHRPTRSHHRLRLLEPCFSGPPIPHINSESAYFLQSLKKINHRCLQMENHGLKSKRHMKMMLRWMRERRMVRIICQHSESGKPNDREFMFTTAPPPRVDREPRADTSAD